MTSPIDTTPTSHSDSVPPTIVLTHDTVPEALDYRSMLVGAALARQEMMMSLGRYGHNNNNNNNIRDSTCQHYHPYNRRFTPYVITNDFIPSSFRPI